MDYSKKVGFYFLIRLTKTITMKNLLFLLSIFLMMLNNIKATFLMHAWIGKKR